MEQSTYSYFFVTKFRSEKGEAVMKYRVGNRTEPNERFSWYRESTEIYGSDRYRVQKSGAENGCTLSTRSGAKYLFIFYRQNSDVKRVKQHCNSVGYSTQPNEGFGGTEKVQKYGTDRYLQSTEEVLKTDV